MGKKRSGNQTQWQMEEECPLELKSKMTKLKIDKIRRVVQL